MKKFWVVIPILAQVNFEVEASTEEEAKQKALKEYKDNGAKYAEGIDAGEVAGRAEVLP
jgi:hypothetical protein